MNGILPAGGNVVVPARQSDSVLELAGRQAVVVGLARTGCAMADFLLQQGAKVVVTDLREAADFQDDARLLKSRGARLELGGHEIETFLSADLIVLSPGVPLTIEPVQLAVNAGVLVMGGMELAAQYLDVPIVAVTGTNGKTTTTSLIGEMLKACGRKAFVGGNIGNPLINLVLNQPEVDYAVVEVSSFQLERVGFFRPQVSILLNITPDHLDRHGTMENYIAAKFRVFADQGAADTAVLNADDAQTNFFTGQAQKFTFSRKKIQTSGAYIDGDFMNLSLNGERIGTWPLNQVNLPGRHNQENIMAAMLAGLALGLDLDACFKAAQAFKGLEHRIEMAASVNGVDYYNDSKATNPGAALMSVDGFKCPVILIAGGRDKDSDFTMLRPVLKEKVKLLILMGEAKSKMFQVLGDTVKTVLVEDMEEAVNLAGRKASTGDVVLLSPACASFDMYESYAHRGRHFKELVVKGAHGS